MTFFSALKRTFIGSEDQASQSPRQGRRTPVVPEYGLKVLAEGDNPVVDIVAIHGLDGSREESWTADNGVCWLGHADFLPKALPQARIMTYGYNAYTRGSLELTSESLFEHSRQLIAKLSLHRQLDDTEHRAIIFICHSLGGLVLKTALIDAGMKHEDHLQGHHVVFKSTYGILFMGTPQAGTDAAHMAQYLLDIRSIFQPTNRELLKHLQPTSESLRHQLSQYTSIQERFVTHVYYEMYETAIVGSTKRMIVGKDSAFLAGTRNVEAIGLHKNHITMVKFPSPEDQDYQSVSSRLRLMVKVAPDNIARSWQRTPASSATRSPVLSSLGSISSSIPAPRQLSAGRYRIQNVQSKASAGLRDSSSPSDLIAIIPGLGQSDGYIWDVEQLVNSRYTIQNVHHSTFAGPASAAPSEDDILVGKDRPAPWKIQEVTQRSGYIIASSTHPDLLWNHSDDEHLTPLMLKFGSTDPRNQWTFIPVR